MDVWWIQRACSLEGDWPNYSNKWRLGQTLQHWHPDQQHSASCSCYICRGMLCASVLPMRESKSNCLVYDLQDMFVDFNLAQQSVQHIKGIRQWITNEYMHSGIKDDGARIFEKLLGMVRESILLTWLTVLQIGGLLPQVHSFLKPGD